MKIQVSQLDIDAGCKGDPYNCPIASAILRAIKRPHYYISVGYLMITIGNEIIPTPEPAKNFMKHFDVGYFGSQSPFEFELEVPNEISL